MIIENENELKRIKQLIGTIQASTLPALKGIDAFSIHQSCEWAYNICMDYEAKLEGKKDDLQMQGQEKENKEVKKVVKGKGKR